MATGQTNTSTSTVAAQMQKFFLKQFLAHAVDSLFLAQWGQKTKLPGGVGAKTVTFSRAMVADISGVVALTEGTPITTIQQLRMEQIDATLTQVGNVIEVSDILTATGLFNYLKDVGIKLLGENAALYLDTMIRNSLCDPANGLTKRYAQGLANFAALAATGTNSAGKLTAADLLGAVTSLRMSKAPGMKGEYACVLPPNVAADIMLDPNWLGVKSYQDSKDLYKGEVGMIFGARCVMGTNPFQEDETEGTFAATFNAGGTNTTGLIYSTVVTGADSYGVVDLASQSIQKPSIIINDKADKSDPLNQKKQAGWKAFYACPVLNPAFGRVIRSKAVIA